ncbi:hypothetical protein [Billgrantia endophytica]|nr:hypothetical protein [Halomonas endophytica]
MMTECTMMSGVLGTVLPIALLLLLALGIAALGKYLFTSNPSTGASS